MPRTTSLLCLVLVAVLLNLMASADVSSIRPGHCSYHLHTVLFPGLLRIDSCLSGPPSDPRALSLAVQLLGIPIKRQLFCHHLCQTVE
jgi:hypothetical protein